MRAYKILLLEQKFITHFEAYTTPELENYKTRASYRIYNHVDPEGILLSIWGLLLFLFSANIHGSEKMLAMIVYLFLILVFFIFYVVLDKKRKGIFLFELYCVEKVLEKRKLKQNKEKAHKEDNENIE